MKLLKNSKITLKKFNQLFLFIFCVLGIVFIIAGQSNKEAEASQMNSNNYRIIFGNLNSGGSTATSGSNFNLDISLGQAAAKLFSSNGYVIKSGFQYVHTLFPFRFYLSDTSIDFGTLSFDTLTDRQFNVEISNRGSGYDVLAIADTKVRRLSSAGIQEIPNTLCNGSPNCSESTATLWDQTDAYGFGYRVTGDDRPADFDSANYFRRFTILSDNEVPVSIMASSGIAKSRVATVTLRMNVSTTQEAGTYQTILRFVAVPRY